MNTDLQGHTASRYVVTDYPQTPRLRSAGATNRTSEHYISEQWTADALLGQLWVELRTEQLQEAYTFVANATQVRHNSYSKRLSQLSQQYRARDGKELVQLLASDYGLSWVDLARMLDVSVPAIRKWRLSGNVSPEKAGRLADLAAFANLLAENGVRPSSWLSTPLVSGFTVAPKHLYSQGEPGALVDVALATGSAVDLLDRVDPGWRVKYDARGYQVSRFDDGTYGIVNTNE